jgi:hypothetical protein
MTTAASGHGPIPRPAQRRLLDAAVGRGEAAAVAWREWKASQDPATIDRASRRLLPAVAANLESAGLGEAEIAALRALAEAVRGEYRERLSLARPVIAALVDAEIDPLLLKGAALARFYGGDAGRRPMRDVDVLVRPDRLDHAIDVLGRLGYAPHGMGLSCLVRYARRRSPGWSFVAPGRPDVDLHWNMLHESRGADADADFWKAAVAIDFEGVPAKALCATDQLLHVCVHGLQPEPVENLRWIADAIAILRHEAEPIDWRRLVEQVVRRGLVPQARYALGFLAEAFDAPIPPRVLEQLRREKTSWIERLELAARLAPRTYRRLGEAVIAHRHETRLDGVRESFARAAPRHLWGAARWWQRPAWALVDRTRLDVPAGSRWSRAIFAPPSPLGADDRPASYRLGERLAFRHDADDLRVLRSGWSYAENVGVWSEGPLARIVLDVAPAATQPLFLEVEIAAVMVAERGAPLEVHGLMNSHRVARWRFDAPLSEPVKLRATVPANVVGGAPRQYVDFRILPPRSPASLGQGNDPRLLGIHLSALRLSPGAFA